MDDVDDNEENRVDARDESGGNPEYKSRRVRREGPAAIRVWATGEAFLVSLQPEEQTAKL